MKKTRQEKRIEYWEDYFRKQILGSACETESDYGLEAMGAQYKNGEMSSISDRKILIAQGKILIALCQDISSIYRALNIYIKKHETRQQLWDTIHQLAIEEANKETKEKEEKAKRKAANLAFSKIKNEGQTDPEPTGSD